MHLHNIFLRKSLFVVIIINLILVQSICANAVAQQLFEQANNAYKNKQYEAAIINYEKIIKSGAISKDVYYNLGNAYFRLNQLGKARLNYERAQKLSSDADIQYNIDIISAHMLDKLPEVNDFFLIRIWKALGNNASAGFWAVLAMICWWLGASGLALWLLHQNRDYKKKGFIVGVAAMLFSAILFALAYSQYQTETDRSQAIIITKETSFQNAPEAASSIILKLHDGSKVKVLDQIGTWSKVQLVNGEQGWILKNSIEII